MNTRWWVLLVTVAVLGVVLAPAVSAQPYVGDFDLEIEKEVADGVEGIEEGDEYAFVVVCDGPESQARTYNVTVAVGEGPVQVGDDGDFFDGDTCRITEVGVEDAEFVVNPAGALVGITNSTVEIVFDADVMGDLTTVTLTVINDELVVLGPGALEVVKEVDLSRVDAPELAADLAFEFTVDCDSIADPIGVTLGDGERFLLENLLAGEWCEVREVGPADVLDELVEAVRVRVRPTDITAEPAAAVGPDGVAGATVRVQVPEVEEPPTISAVFTNVLAEPPVVPPVEPEPVPPVEPEPVVEPAPPVERLPVTGFQVTWAMLLALALLIPGGGFLLWARRRENGEGETR